MDRRFVAEAKLAEETPLVHGLRERLVAIEKKSTAMRSKMKEAMTPTKPAIDANREKLESLLKVEVDLKKEFSAGCRADYRRPLSGMSQRQPQVG